MQDRANNETKKDTKKDNSVSGDLVTSFKSIPCTHRRLMDNQQLFPGGFLNKQIYDFLLFDKIANSLPVSLNNNPLSIENDVSSVTPSLTSMLSTFLPKVSTPSFFSRKDFDIAWEQYEKLCANQSNERSAAFQELSGFLTLNGSSDEETRKAWEEKLNELEELTGSYPAFDHSNKQQTAQSIWTLIDARTKHHSKVMSLFESILNVENRTETKTVTLGKQQY